ncbi:MAG: hypothetical protein ABWJ42_00135 [Sulfolobales archaeon]
MLRGRLLVLLVLSLLVVSLISQISTSTSGYSVSVKWVRYSIPSRGVNIANSLCVLRDNLYVVGADSYSGDLEFRVEKRSLYTGDSIKNWTYNPSPYYDVLLDCVVVGGRLYVVGVDMRSLLPQWTLLSLDQDLNLLLYTNSPNAYGSVMSVDSDSDYIYLAGFSLTSLPGLDSQWRVEKRRITDLSLVAERSSNPSPTIDIATVVRVNPVTNTLWVAGFDNSTGILAWRIEVLDKNLSLIKVIRPGINGTATSLAFDESGNSYVTGVTGLIKIDPWGSVLKINREVNGSAVMYYNNTLYIVGSEEISGRLRLVLYILDRDLNLLSKTVLSPDLDLDAMPSNGKIALYNNTLYTTSVLTNTSIYVIAVYAIEISYQPTETATPITNTTTVTMQTTAVQNTTTVTITLTQISTAYTTEYRTTTLAHTQTTTIYTPATYATLIRTSTVTTSVILVIRDTLTYTLTNLLERTALLTRSVVVEREVTLPVTQTTTLITGEGLSIQSLLAGVLVGVIIGVVLVIVIRREIQR